MSNETPVAEEVVEPQVESQDATEEQPQTETETKDSEENAPKRKSRGNVTSLRGMKEVPCDLIISNKYNPDDSRLDNLSQMGYVNFPDEVTEETPENHILSELAMGDPAQRKEFAKLIEEHEPDLVELGENMLQVGQLQPVQLRPASRVNDTYQLVFGCRRFFALLYIRAKIGVPFGKINAAIQKTNESQARLAALSENIHRKGVDKVREAEQIRDMVKAGKKVSDIAKELGWSQQTVKNRVDVADAPDNVKNRVRKGTLGITKAALISRDIKAGGDGKNVGKETQAEKAENEGAPKRRTTLGFKHVAAMYDKIYLQENEDNVFNVDEDAKQYFRSLRKGNEFFPGLARILQYERFSTAEKEARERLSDPTYYNKLMQELGVELVDEEEEAEE